MAPAGPTAAVATACLALLGGMCSPWGTSSHGPARRAELSVEGPWQQQQRMETDPVFPERELPSAPNAAGALPAGVAAVAGAKAEPPTARLARLGAPPAPEETEREEREELEPPASASALWGVPPSAVPIVCAAAFWDLLLLGLPATWGWWHRCRTSTSLDEPAEEARQCGTREAEVPGESNASRAASRGRPAVQRSSSPMALAKPKPALKAQTGGRGGERGAASLASILKVARPLRQEARVVRRVSFASEEGWVLS
uniref:Uncharacterized protein n=1 Tax=Alexandrium monilatum TaxID=311494 RepID=A0A7S4Q0Q8_9DINO